ncbi:hypothetical protein SDC9_82518 [bioreactor metagenome]|uniref:Uncharacterized protein n=1 Tax=bioreactor metagenome TaxID=1076179 RepID=A0A644ZDG2_9ZZZZ
MRAADALDLVGGNGDADAGRADDNALFTLAGGHGTGRRLAEDGIVAALRGKTAAVLALIAVLLQLPLDFLL